MLLILLGALGWAFATLPPSPSERYTLFSQTAHAVWRTLAPVVKLAAVVDVIGVALTFMDLPSVIRQQDWNERTVLAFSIVFTFCAVVMLQLPTEPTTAIKDVALTVIGFSSVRSRRRVAGGVTPGGRATRKLPSDHHGLWRRTAKRRTHHVSPTSLQEVALEPLVNTSGRHSLRETCDSRMNVCRLARTRRENTVCS